MLSLKVNLKFVICKIDISKYIKNKLPCLCKIQIADVCYLF